MIPFVRHILMLFCAVWLVGCTGHGTHAVGELPVDLLNRKAQSWCYRNLDSTQYYAQQAYETSHYAHGRIVSCNMLGFVSAMRMEYDEALRWYGEAYKHSGCELERFVADVGCMEVYQRMADNLSFYESRVRAEKRLAHIEEEIDNFSASERNRLQATTNRMHLVTSQHHYMMGQLPEANAEIQHVVEDDALRADTAQWLMYTYLKGIGINVEGDTREQRMLRRYTYLNNCLRMSRVGEYTYFAGMASMGLSQLLADSVRMDYIARMRPNSFSELNDSAHAAVNISMSFAQESLQLFERYGDAYSCWAATVQMASLHNRRGEYEVALSLLPLAEDIAGAPDVVARMHEEASLAFAGLDDKAASDYHRNQYLDLLETTRQDKELESRYLSLERQRRRMHAMLYVTIAGMAVLALLVFMLTRRRKQGGGYEQQLIGLAQEAGKRVYLHRKHIEKGKRDNIVRKASFSVVTGMMPYIDRMAHEIERLQEPEVWDDKSLRTRKLEYVAELTKEINNLNDILTQWVKTTQGMVGLHIESFALDEVFEMIGRSAASFAQKGLTLEVNHTEAVVKADKALTFFMLNTLADNARKFTPEGGRVSITADVCEEYVELSVADNGLGMSAEDMDCILHTKVYDAAAIGQSLPPEQRKNKGSGFGLLNCRGVIEKYRKTDALFEVCRFGVESGQEGGCRFWFRLPKGIRRLMSLLCVLIPMNMFASSDSVAVEQGVPFEADLMGADYDQLLVWASAFADSVYYANVSGHYAEALRYADSAFVYLNAHHRKYASDYIGELTATMGESDVETRWWLSDFSTDYHTILDVRNELAVANLALRRWSEYRYNNRIYNDLYKLVSEDRSLIEYCGRMQRYNNNIFVAILVCVLLILGYLAVIAHAFMGRVESAYRDIEEVEEDERRARHEENRLHVQNMVLDNCLSTIKHETVYYPNRIKQLVDRLDEHDERHQMKELVGYYKTIFSMLTACASRQLDEVTFRRTTIEADALLDEALRYHSRRRKLYPEAPELTIEGGQIQVSCDAQLISFLLEQLIDASLAESAQDKLVLRVRTEGGFARFTLINASRVMDREVMNNLFAPSPERLKETPDGKVCGMEYVVARQIIREHDSYFGHVGCRIKAEPLDEGYSVWFTIPIEK